MNAVLGTIQHEKARKSLESLKKLSAPAARVLRDGREQEIPAAKLVPGDIVLLDARKSGGGRRTAAGVPQSSDE